MHVKGTAEGLKAKDTLSAVKPKLMFLTIPSFEKDGRAAHGWVAARNQLAIKF